MLKVEIVNRHFVNTFLLKLIGNVGGAGDCPDHVFCAPVGGPSGGGEETEMQTYVPVFLC